MGKEEGERVKKEGSEDSGVPPPKLTLKEGFLWNLFISARLETLEGRAP